MKTNILKTLAALCLLAITLPKANATIVNWSCDPGNGTYCIIDIDGGSSNLAPAGNPYYIYVPQNIAPGESMVAHLRARCSSDAVNTYSLKAVARGPQGYQEDSTIVYTSSSSYNTPDSLFNVYDSCDRIEFSYYANGNTKLKFYKFWIPMPVHLDARDHAFNDSVALYHSRNYQISLNTFLTWDDMRDITITPVSDPSTDSADFSIVKDRIVPRVRCGRSGWNTVSFTNTLAPTNQFVIRFTPSAAGIRTAKFLISNGRGNEDTITVTAKGFVYNPAAISHVYARSANHHMGAVRIVGGVAHNTGDTVSVRALPRRGYIFMGWSDGTRNANYSLALTKDTFLVAHFALADDVFHFTAEQRNANIKLASLNGTSTVGLIYSADNGDTWSTLDIDSTKTIVHRGHRLYVRADSFNTRFGSILSDGSIEGYHFQNDSVSVAGDIMYLLNTYGIHTALSDTAFAGLFNGSEIVNATLLGLPLTVSRACYYGMFQNCATLKAAPLFPAVLLADYCYAYMFEGCSSLNSAPLLPAAHLVNHCYCGMFRNCTTLNHINVAFISWNEADSATFDWVNNVDTVGLFLSAAPLPQIVDSTHIPYNWISDPVILAYHSSNIFWGHVTATDAATGAPIRSGSIIARGTDVVMTAIPHPGFMFVHWVNKGGFSHYLRQTDTIRIIGNTSIEAVFHPGYRPNPIMADPDTGTETISETVPELNVFTEGTSIIISGMDNPDVSIYDATGRLVTRVENATGQIDVKTPGVYFVQVNGQPAIRIVVK